MKGLASFKKQNIDMTHGNIYQQLSLFAVPLFMGNLFQQFYNLVDTWVVGNFSTNAAFAAVGSVTSIVNMLLNAFIALSNGAGVVISQYYGARKLQNLKQTVHTAMMMSLLVGILFTFIGLWAAPLMLKIANMPPSVAPEALTYLNIYFSGMLAMVFYNIGASVLRAIGDSTKPFYFLVVSALINIVLDLIFVIHLDMGVAGVAWATVISQAVSAVLVIVVLFKTSTCVRLQFTALRIHKNELTKILIIGIPSAIQMAVTAFSNVFVQSYINHFGEDLTAAWAAYAKIDHLLFLPMQALAYAVSTFVGQNLGNNNVERAKKGTSAAIKLALLVTAILLIPIVIFAPHIVAIFNDKPEVVYHGTRFLRYISPFYMVCVINQVLAMSLRGSGNSKAPMIIMLSSFVVFRQVYLFITANFISNTILPIAMGYPAGWIVASVITLVYYKKTDLASKRLVE